VFRHFLHLPSYAFSAFADTPGGRGSQIVYMRILYFCPDFLYDYYQSKKSGGPLQCGKPERGIALCIKKK